MKLVRSSGYSELAKFRAIIFVLISSFAMTSCGSLPTIATVVDYCCQAGAERIHSYRIEFEDMPEFLKPMLRDEVSLVLSSKGLDYTEGDADSILTLAYVDRPVTQPTIDANDAVLDEVREESADDVNEAWGSLSAGGDTRFIAEVHLKLKNSVTQELVWSGVMSKLHNVSVGSYMHEAPARAAMRNAFFCVVCRLPGPDYRKILRPIICVSA